ncbi:hypothetical protein [Bordetella sp. 2513F-2]
MPGPNLEHEDFIQGYMAGLADCDSESDGIPAAAPPSAAYQAGYASAVSAWANRVRDGGLLKAEEAYAQWLPRQLARAYEAIAELDRMLGELARHQPDLAERYPATREKWLKQGIDFDALQAADQARAVKP